ncbi:hypothetical protein [Pusillimonas sp. ANT_WB101]|uniref:hypothetical protein n=1 Tax=Pusillimonas sp. ANT_WB101 TaxID=2597356 RepID=UPI0011F051D6|nr:hypothetical protein [Pusillimonas sp. ANT_WB101]KAA0889985.1 hypothetical protein FQ179_16690 [Pusillimonas sp. ANT_WB101]
MNAEKFLSYLPWLRLPKEVISQKELDEEFDHQQIISTTPINRSELLFLDNAPDDISALFRSYDLSTINMLWTTFLSEPTKIPEGWHFANMPRARIVRVPSGRIESYFYHPDKALNAEAKFLDAIAKNMDAYLEALICGAMARRHVVQGFSEKPDIQEKLEPVAQLCTVLAGGDEYKEFWFDVIGVGAQEW